MHLDIIFVTVLGVIDTPCFGHQPSGHGHISFGMHGRTKGILLWSIAKKWLQRNEHRGQRQFNRLPKGHYHEAKLVVEERQYERVTLSQKFTHVGENGRRSTKVVKPCKMGWDVAAFIVFIEVNKLVHEHTLRIFLSWNAWAHIVTLVSVKPLWSLYMWCKFVCTMKMNVYDSLEFLPIIFPHWFSLGPWWFGHHLFVMRSIMTLNLWTMGFTLNMEVFIHYHCCHYNFQE